jgi:predicted  nucleic acid-binding Zn-ribbon protein
VLIQRGELDRLNTLLNTIRNELAEANARAWRAEQRAVELEARVRHLEENGGGNG